MNRADPFGKKNVFQFCIFKHNVLHSGVLHLHSVTLASLPNHIRLFNCVDGVQPFPNQQHAGLWIKKSPELQVVKENGKVLLHFDLKMKTNEILLDILL